MTANAWEPALDAFPTGVALVDTGGRIRWVNRAGAAILCRPRDELIGVTAPFRPGGDAGPGLAVPGEPAERLCAWPAGPQDVRWLAWTDGAAVRLDGVGVGSTLFGFRDVTENERGHQRVAAVARIAASMASNSSPGEVLEAMAAEIQRSHGVAGTQIMTFAPGGDRLQLMGSAGFATEEPFFDLLMASRDRGAELVTDRSMRERRQCVVPGRRAQMLADPSWEPMHGYVAQLDWEDFVSTPLLSRGKVLGALTVYVAAGDRATPAMLDFLTAMAEQAALAVDYATLIDTERVSARREERRRLARELHDSVVQHVFSIGMQAKALSGLARRLDGPPAERVRAVAGEVTDLVDSVQRDLRGVVLALQPSVAAALGLLAALRVLADDTVRRHGVHVVLAVDAAIEGRAPSSDFTEDIYQIIAEALHNAVKHAAPTTVRVDARLGTERPLVRIEVVDDGGGVPAGSDGRRGFGLTSMRERAARWGGSVAVTANGEGPGTRVRAELPLPHGTTGSGQEGTA